MAPQGKLKQGSKAVSMYEAKGILVGQAMVGKARVESYGNLADLTSLIKDGPRSYFASQRAISLQV